MTVLLNSFEGGTSGTTITTGNSGGASGNALDLVNIPIAATAAYDSTHAAQGALSCKLATGGTAGNVYVGWSTSMGSQAQVWFRAYLYFTGNPVSTQRVLEFLQGGTTCGGVTLSTSGHLASVNATGSTIQTQAGVVVLNAWFRLEGFILGSATVGQIEFKRFDSPGSATPSETTTSTATQNTTGNMDTYRYGHAAGGSIASLGPWWQDSIGLSSTGYIGPVPVKAAGSGTSIVPALVASGAIA